MTTSRGSRERMLALRARLRSGDRIRPIRLKKHYLDRLEEQGYLDPFKRGEAAAEIEAVECYLANTRAASRNVIAADTS